MKKLKTKEILEAPPVGVRTYSRWARLDSDEIKAIEESNTPQLYVIAGEINYEEKDLILHFGNHMHIAVPLDRFKHNAKVAPDFEEFRIVDGGLTLEFGDYQAPVWPIIYETHWRDDRIKKTADLLRNETKIEKWWEAICSINEIQEPEEFEKDFVYWLWKNTGLLFIDPNNKNMISLLYKSWKDRNRTDKFGPCPECGSKKEPELTIEGMGSSKTPTIVRCTECDLSIRIGRGLIYSAIRREAVYQWNNATPPSKWPIN